MARSLKYCCFDIMERMAPGSSVASFFLSSADAVTSRSWFLIFSPAPMQYPQMRGHGCAQAR
jgi:hypothetical protein